MTRGNTRGERACGESKALLAKAVRRHQPRSDTSVRQDAEDAARLRMTLNGDGNAEVSCPCRMPLCGTGCAMLTTLPSHAGPRRGATRTPHDDCMMQTSAWKSG